MRSGVLRESGQSGLLIDLASSEAGAWDWDMRDERPLWSLGVFANSVSTLLVAFLLYASGLSDAFTPTIIIIVSAAPMPCSAAKKQRSRLNTARSTPNAAFAGLQRAAGSSVPRTANLYE